MPSGVNKNKVWVVSILCFAVILSVWLSQRQIVDTTPVYEKIEGLTAVDSLIDLPETTNKEWEKILVNINSKNQVVTNLTKTNDDAFDETTLTAQISKDFLSQYLLLKQGGRTLTDDDINGILTNILKTKNYTEVKGALYIPLNLKITSNNNGASKEKYKNSVNLVIANRSSELRDDPILLVNQSLGPKKKDSLTKINSVIKTGKSFIEDFLKIEVPSQYVVIHLELLNAVSNIVADVEAMREIDSDPLRSLMGISQYNKDLITLQDSINKIKLQFVQN